MSHTSLQLGNLDSHVFTQGKLTPEVAIMRTRPHPYVAAGGYPPAPGKRAPRYKDLRYDDRPSWKFFLHKFVMLARSQLWSAFR
jgi:hypothetical protein